MSEFFLSSSFSSTLHCEDARTRGVSFKSPETFESLTGKGLQGKVNDKEVKVVSPGYVNEKQISYDQDVFDQLSSQGKTVVFVIVNGKLAGMIALVDKIRENAKQAITDLKTYKYNR